jgi:hypothetical protein
LVGTVKGLHHLVEFRLFLLEVLLGTHLLFLQENNTIGYCALLLLNAAPLLFFLLQLVTDSNELLIEPW